MRIGIDIGGVIIGGGQDDTSFFTDDFLATPAVYMAEESIYVISRAHRGHEIFFISKAGPKTAQKTIEWLNARNFLWKHGIDAGRLIFCRTRAQKVPIAQLLELDVFIDDREDICVAMRQAGIPAIQFTKWFTTLEQLDEMETHRIKE